MTYFIFPDEVYNLLFPSFEETLFEPGTERKTETVQAEGYAGLCRETLSQNKLICHSKIRTNKPQIKQRKPKYYLMAFITVKLDFGIVSSYPKM